MNILEQTLYGLGTVTSVARKVVYEKFPKLRTYDLQKVFLGDFQMSERKEVKRHDHFSLRYDENMKLYRWLEQKREVLFSADAENLAQLTDGFIEEVLENKRVVLLAGQMYELILIMKRYLGKSMGDELYKELRFRDMLHFESEEVGGN